MKPRLYAFLVVLFACCLTACASRGGQNPSPASCVVPASICKPTTSGGTIYLDDHNYWCCTECPDECESEAKSGEGE